MDHLRQMLLGKVSMTDMRPEDRRIRGQEANGDVELLELFGSEPFKYAEGDPTHIHDQLFFAQDDVVRPRLKCKDIATFVERLNKFSNGLVQALRDVRGSLDGVVVAGGSVLGALMNGMGRATDIDLFLAQRGRLARLTLAPSAMFVIASPRTIFLKELREEAQGAGNLLK